MDITPDSVKCSKNFQQLDNKIARMIVCPVVRSITNLSIEGKNRKIKVSKANAYKN